MPLGHSSLGSRVAKATLTYLTAAELLCRSDKQQTLVPLV